MYRLGKYLLSREIPQTDMQEGTEQLNKGHNLYLMQVMLLWLMFARRSTHSILMPLPSYSARSSSLLFSLTPPFISLFPRVNVFGTVNLLARQACAHKFFLYTLIKKLIFINVYKIIIQRLICFQ